MVLITPDWVWDQIIDVGSFVWSHWILTGMIPYPGPLEKRCVASTAWTLPGTFFPQHDEDVVGQKVKVVNPLHGQTFLQVWKDAKMLMQSCSYTRCGTASRRSVEGPASLQFPFLATMSALKGQPGLLSGDAPGPPTVKCGRSRRIGRLGRGSRRPKQMLSPVCNRSWIQSIFFHLHITDLAWVKYS